VGRVRRRVAPGWRREVGRVPKQPNALAPRKRPLHVPVLARVLARSQTRGKSGPSGTSAPSPVALAVEKDGNASAMAIVRLSAASPFKCGSAARKSPVQSQTQLASGRRGRIGPRAMEHVRRRRKNAGAIVATAGASARAATKRRSAARQVTVTCKRKTNLTATDGVCGKSGAVGRNARKRAAPESSNAVDTVHAVIDALAKRCGVLNR